MKNIFHLSPLLALLLASCYGIKRSGHVSSGPLLSVKDKYVGVACGEVDAKMYGKKYYDREHLIMESKMNMYKNRPLKKGEYYSNLMLNIEVRERWYYFFITARVKISVCADVMSTNFQNDSLPFSPEFRELINTVSRQNEFTLHRNPETKTTSQTSFTSGEIEYKLHDTIFVNVGGEEDECSTMEIVNIQDKKVNLHFVNLPRPNKTIDISKYEFFSRTKTLNGFSRGDKVRILSSFDANKSIPGVVLGANNKKIIVSSEYGNFPYLPERLKK